MSHDYSKKDYYNHWVPKRTLDDVYDLVKSLSKTVAELKKELEIVKEQNVDALEMLDEITNATLDGDFNITIVADGYVEPEAYEATTLGEIIVDYLGEVPVYEEEPEEEPNGCGGNCKCKKELPLGGEDELDDIIRWLNIQIGIAERNEGNPTAFERTLEHIKRLQKFLGK